MNHIDSSILDLRGNAKMERLIRTINERLRANRERIRQGYQNRPVCHE